MSLLFTKGWLDSLKEECFDWYDTLLMIINFHHHDAARCIDLINSGLSELGNIFQKHICQKVVIFFGSTGLLFIFMVIYVYSSIEDFISVVLKCLLRVSNLFTVPQNSGNLM